VDLLFVGIYIKIYSKPSQHGINPIEHGYDGFNRVK